MLQRAFLPEPREVRELQVERVRTLRWTYVSVRDPGDSGSRAAGRVAAAASTTSAGTAIPVSATSIGNVGSSCPVSSLATSIDTQLVETTSVHDDGVGTAIVARWPSASVATPRTVR